MLRRLPVPKKFPGTGSEVAWREQRGTPSPRLGSGLALKPSSPATASYLKPKSRGSPETGGDRRGGKDEQLLPEARIFFLDDF